MRLGLAGAVLGFLIVPSPVAPALSPYHTVLTRYGATVHPTNPWAPRARHEVLQRPWSWYDMGLNGASPGRQLADL